ncbi:MAG: response regulator [Gemmatimonadota bacterium]
MARILFAEDDRGMQEMVSAVLGAAGHSVRAVDDGRAALAAISTDLPDLAVLDYRMGRPDGLEVCRQIKEDPRLEHLPVLILTAEGDMDDRIDGFAAGANDYLTKPFDPRELVARVGALLRLSEQGRDLNPTTGLPGSPAIAREFARRAARDAAFTLCYLDLDHFKPFNDRFGFPTANAAIEAVGRVLRGAVSADEHFAGHIGGDDFVLICRPDTARHLVVKIQADFSDALRTLLPHHVLEKGTYLGHRRDGVEAEIPVTRLTAALLHVPPGRAPTYAELGEIAAKTKDLAKRSKKDGIAETELGE